MRISLQLLSLPTEPCGGMLGTDLLLALPRVLLALVTGSDGR